MSIVGHQNLQYTVDWRAVSMPGVIFGERAPKYLILQNLQNLQIQFFSFVGLKLHCKEHSNHQNETLIASIHIVGENGFFYVG